MWNNDLVLPIHVTAAKDRRRGLCGERVLDGMVPPETVDLDSRRQGDGTVIALADVELEMGWIANQPRHPNAAKLGGPCEACLARVARMRLKEAAIKTGAAATREAKAQQRKRSRVLRQLEWERRVLEEIGE